MSEGQGGWEQTKENIQPLSTGRRMAYLAGSLPIRSGGGLTEQQKYESMHLEEVKKLEEAAMIDNGTDPLQGWVKAIHYLEQNFPNKSSTVQSKYSSLVQKILENFYDDERYRNDKRYIDVVLRMVEIQPKSTMKIFILQNLLDNGTGTQASCVYTRLAELLQEEGKTREATVILRNGIQMNAMPVERLQEMLTHIQEQWAAKHQQQLLDNKDGGNEMTGSRTFASSVPVYGENNEAVPIRQHLQPAAPIVHSKQSTQRQAPLKLQGFNEFENENGELSQISEIENRPPVKSKQIFSGICGKDGDAENRLDAGRWNTDNAHLNNPVIPEPPPKLQIYNDADISQSSSSKDTKRPSDARVLKERKEDGEDKDIALHSHDNRPIVATTATSANDSQRVEKTHNPPKSICDTFKPEHMPKLPHGRKVNLAALKGDKWLAARDKRLKEKESRAKEIEDLRKKVEEFRESSERLSGQVRVANMDLKQKEEKIQELERANENLMGQLTALATKQNKQESQFDREIRYYKQKELDWNETLAKLEEKLQECQLERDKLLQYKLSEDKSKLQLMKDDESSEFEGILVSKNTSAVDRRPIFVDVRSRNSDNYSPSTSTEQATSESSRFHSGDTTCAAANSFMPPDTDMSIVGMGNQNSQLSEINRQDQERRALVDRPLANDMMNDTPATAPDMNFEPPPLCLPGGGFGLLKKPTKFNLYQSQTSSFLNVSNRKPSQPSFMPRKNDVSNDQENLPLSRQPQQLQPPRQPDLISNENEAPPRASASLHYDFVGNAENRSVNASEIDREQQRSDEIVHGRGTGNSHFVRPDIPAPRRSTFNSNENQYHAAAATNGAGSSTTNYMSNSNVSQRLAYLSTIPLNDFTNDAEEGEDIIVRRHQQTGMDLNVSNLTDALMLGPKPLVNSTLRSIRSQIGGPAQNGNTQEEMEETEYGYQGGPTVSALISRYNSAINDPHMNLSPIQETSREFRSRSTTGSSSSAVSAAASATSATTPFGGSKSSSMPRSPGRGFQQFNYNNGYYSDTGSKS